MFISLAYIIHIQNIILHFNIVICNNSILFLGVSEFCNAPAHNKRHNFKWTPPRYVVYVQDILLAHPGQKTYICVSKLAICSDNGLSHIRHKAIFCSSANLLSIRPKRTHINEILFKIPKFSYAKIHLKMSFPAWRPSCVGLNMLMHTNHWCDKHPFLCASVTASEIHPINVLLIISILSLSVTFSIAPRTNIHTFLSHCGLVTSYGVTYLCRHSFR